MTRESMENLRLDRRLLRRRGWISPKELEAALEALPDVAQKAITLGEVDGRDAAGKGAEGSGTA
jgi:hypothetical protein